jgi:hypothetical protein
MLDLDALQALAAAATPGRWQAHNADGGGYVYAPDAHYPSLPGNLSPVKVAWLPDSHGGRPVRDAAYIAAADPTTILSLIGEVRALRESVRILQENWPRTVAAPMDRAVNPPDDAVLVTRDSLDAALRVVDDWHMDGFARRILAALRAQP